MSHPSEPRSTTQDDGGGAHETVLVVDDDPAVREVVRSGLEAFGYLVLDAGDGAAALQICRDRAAGLDLVVTDIVMPNMDGFELADKVQLYHPKCRTLFMSGYSEDDSVSRGLRSRSEAFIQKPFSYRELATKIRAVLDAPA